ncbi:MAG: UDP-N-acetylmuramoyl-L-alanyl-D-glutamate--2,6-diaminopimelate ligase [Epulopiscium sp.]|nr:UDP-N-acetylmuramoyl-L-alanyl-D-glutamate--2,6-diaminopimelate ligase [Candidatus Epulonipiscium sp.]
MKLKEILNNISYECVQGSLDLQIEAITYDSRVKTKDGLFICIEGYTVDGHNYIKPAIENGARAIIIQKDINIDIAEDITIIKVEDTRSSMATISSNYYKHPSKDLKLVGITGTNGKTTTAHLIAWILESVSNKIGIIGTIENRIGSQVIKAEHTTPESLDLQRILSMMKAEDVSHAVMEVSSHALELDRVKGTEYKVGVFTNLSQDHLDFHKTLDNYLDAKTKLFTMCEKGVINIDDPSSAKILDMEGFESYTFGIDKDADFKGENIEITDKGVNFDLIMGTSKYPVFMPIPGKFSVYNALAAIASTYLMGIRLEDAISTLSNVPGVPGRVQRISSHKGFSVIVDYAHTPDGLENVLKTVNEFTKSKVITVFGCGGDRDKSKRPIMGQVAGKYSDYTIITSDNPRSEDPESILKDIEEGIKESDWEYEKIIDREMAIKAAIKMAQKGDVIVIAGKGHEDYQILKDRIIHFDDVEIVNKYLQEV